MKTAYIISLLLLSTIIYAQENKQATLVEDQTQALKQIKEHEAKLMQDAKENIEKQTAHTGLTSDRGLEVKKQEQKPKVSNSSGVPLPNTATLEEIKRTIPNRQAYHNTINSRNTKSITGLPNTATLEEIKKTIPKN
ncbi:uncharacterized protein CHSO_0416 [Chryseobacterium sp. StRB126]|uniref:hypothetical protein n=1 Tax=Chryseobacterium sp. StRB126 TaxID=878220 RepID=UPI0004E997A1|nr:hypothetical protein [Chryseobacterium sp. StRB126]BAP29453.1 uncharacterized protein CHSO_0416 [Chryseobacterium sp. StRB126]